MAHSNYIQGIRIITNSNYGSDISLGLYQTGAENSEFRFVENTVTLTDTPTAWAAGFINADGIGAISSGFDARRGGCAATMDGCNIILSNTYQNILRIKDLGINFYQCLFKIYEFVMTTANTETSRAVIATLTVESIKWNETSVEIKLVNSKYRKTRPVDNIVDAATYPNALDADIGKYIPETYGIFNPTINQKAKLTKTGGKETVKIAGDLIPSMDNDEARANKWFVVVAGTAISDTTQYNVYYLKAWHTGAGSDVGRINDVNNLYVKVVEDAASDNVGRYRKINVLQYNTADANIIISLDNIFETSLTFNSTGTAAGNAWCQIVHISDGFSLDTAECGGFIGTEGEVLSNPELFAYENGFKQTYDGCLKLNSNGLQNKIDFNANGFKESMLKQDSFKIIPLSVVDSSDNFFNYPSTLTGWGKTGWGAVAKIASATEKCSAIYKNAGSVANETEADDGHINSRISTETPYARHWDLTLATGANFYVMSVFKLLADIADYDFTTIYFGLKMNLKRTVSAGVCGVNDFNIYYKRHSGNIKQVFTDTEAGYINSLTLPTITLNNMPDFYFSPAALTYNANFFKAMTLISDNTNPINGYSLFKLDISTIEELKSYQYFYIISEFYHGSGAVVVGLDWNIYDACLIFKKSIDLTSAYTYCEGRVFTVDLWGARRTAGNTIISPVDMIEDIKRREIGGVSLINTAAFDAANALPALSTAEPAIQFTNENDKAAIICRDYLLTNYKDKNGQECVNYLPDDTAAIIAALSLTDIIGNKIDVIEAQQQDVFCQPIVNYRYNYAADKYDAVLEITNIDQNEFNFAYTPGITDYNTALRIWSKCRLLYLRYRQIEENPNELTDKKSICVYTDALQYLEAWVNWMGKRRASFDVAYTTGRNWNLVDIVTLQLPHQTADVAVKCKIEKITKNKNYNRISVNVIILDDLDIDTGIIQYQEKAESRAVQYTEISSATAAQLAEHE